MGEAHLLLDEQPEQIFVMTVDIAERARKIGGNTLGSIGDISRHQRIEDAEDRNLSFAAKCFLNFGTLTLS